MLTTKQKQALGAAGIATVLAAAGATANLAKPFEGQKLTPYRDPVGILTVCYGETHNVQNRRYTPAECDQLINDKMIDYAAQVYECHPDLPFSVLVAATDIVYNVRNGRAIVCTGVVGQKLSAKDYPSACRQMLAYNRGGGKVLPGLDRRRKADYQKCMEDVK